jgi:S-methylmethionine-dependent homocysteine/selenocysteine methylase
VELLEEIRAEAGTPVVISGCVGPRGDGYVPGALMSADEATKYHSAQVGAFGDSAADLVTSITMNYIEEAVGVTRAAQQAQMPAVISFTVETDGKLPGGQTLAAAIGQVDAETDGYPAYYMVNCAHPEHFASALTGTWLKRLRGVRANASRMSHAELNESPTLDIGNPDELGQQYASLLQKLPNFNVMGGCCGTDHRHIAAIADACAPAFKK